MTDDHSSEESQQSEQTSADIHADPVHDHDEQADHGDPEAHDEHDGHGVDSGAEASTLVPTTWRQLIFPALILIIVAILVAGPVTGAFAPKPGTSAGQVGVAAPTATATPPSASPTAAPASPASTATPVSAVPLVSPTQAQGQSQPPGQPTGTGGLSDTAIATRTAVAQAGEQGIVTRAPVELDFVGAKFTVQASEDGVLPDWKPAQDEGKAVWIKGTYANQVIYLPFSDTNAALFAATKPGDIVQLVMDTGQTFQFSVTLSDRALNGPPSGDGQFTTATAMSQDHAGVTIFLVGDPAPDRAVVQADFNGNIQ